MTITPADILIIAIVALTGFVSTRAFRNPEALDRLALRVDAILMGKQYDRLLGSMLVHINWPHLLMNGIAFVLFAQSVGLAVGPEGLLAIYIGSGVAGGLLALLIHRNHGDYSAVGASGGVVGVLFAAILFFPDMRLGGILIPPVVPGWAFAIIYVLGSMFGIARAKDPIGHEAHLGGAMAGMAIASMLQPALVLSQWPLILLLFGLVAYLLFMWLRLPQLAWLNYPEEGKLAAQLILRETVSLLRLGGRSTQSASKPVHKPQTDGNAKEPGQSGEPTPAQRSVQELMRRLQTDSSQDEK